MADTAEEVAAHYEEAGDVAQLVVAAEEISAAEEQYQQDLYNEDHAAALTLSDVSAVAHEAHEEPVKKRRRGQGTSVPRWTPDEEDKLRALVAECGERDWAKVAEKLCTNRSAAGVDQHGCAKRRAPTIAGTRGTLSLISRHAIAFRCSRCAARAAACLPHRRSRTLPARSWPATVVEAEWTARAAWTGRMAPQAAWVRTRLTDHVSHAAQANYERQAETQWEGEQRIDGHRSG